MIEFPWAYQKIEPTTWAYMSSLLMLAVFFKFSRFWSIRNVDLFLIILLAPGLLLYQHGTQIEREACVELAKYDQPVALSLTSGGHLVRATNPQPTQPQKEELDPDQAVTPSEQEKNSETPPIDDPEIEQDSDAFDLPPKPKFQKVEEKKESESKESPAPLPVVSVQKAAQNPVDRPEVTEETQLAIEKWQKRRLLGLNLLRTAFYFLLIVSAVLLIRLLLDQLLVRKPLLGNNLSSGGMTFVLCGLLTFLIANIVVSQPIEKDLFGAKSAAKILGETNSKTDEQKTDVAEAELGPAYPLIHLLPVLSTVIHDQTVGESPDTDENLPKEQKQESSFVWVAKLMAILSQFAIVAGLISLGKYHYGSLETGIGMATLYLMLPYTAQMTGRVDHVLPSALLLWAVVLYRFPFWAGILFGLVFGLVYYPVFLLALWLSFYWEKGALRFTYGVLVMFALLVLSLLLISTEQQPFLYNLQATFGIRLPRISGLKGIWELAWDPWFRLPFLVAFVSLCFSFVAWPPRKTLGTLMAYSAAAMVAAQFWHGDGGGLYMAWFLPLTLATFFRPNLHQKIATSEVK